MKPFDLNDTFLLSQIISDLDIEVDLNEFLDAIIEDKKKKKEGGSDEDETDNKLTDPEYVGGQFFLLLIKRWYRGKDSIPQFVANLTEKTVEEARKMTMVEMKDFFIDLFKQEGIQDFFK